MLTTTDSHQHRALALLDSRGLGRVWELYTADSAELLQLGAIEYDDGALFPTPAYTALVNTVDNLIRLGSLSDSGYHFLDTILSHFPKENQ